MKLFETWKIINHRTVHRISYTMRRTSVTTGQNIARQAMDLLNQNGSVSIELSSVGSTSHTWVPIFDRVRFYFLYIFNLFLDDPNHNLHRFRSTKYQLCSFRLI